jgi:excisionase family DNA binding protein
MRKRTFGTHDIARLCQVTPPTIGRWIEEGKLPSFKTAGGHRRVWDTDLVAFLKSHNIPVPPQFAATLRVLIVDDEPEIRQFVRRVLISLVPGAEISEAGDGFEAGRMVATLMPRLVVLDIRLPGMDGFKVCSSIRADPAFKDVKILAITGVGVEDSRRQILDAGADAFLPKPFEAEELAVQLKKMLPEASGREG